MGERMVLFVAQTRRGPVEVKSSFCIMVDQARYEVHVLVLNYNACTRTPVRKFRPLILETQPYPEIDFSDHTRHGLASNPGRLSSRGIRQSKYPTKPSKNT